MRDLKIVFMGTPEFSLPSLKAIFEKGYEILAVVTQPDRPKGRGRKVQPPPVKVLAEELGLPVIQPEDASEKDFIEKIRSLKPDLIVVVAYGQILKKELLEIPHLGAINAHPSLLPKYRGASPIQWAIMNNESETGVTIIRMTEKMDAGPILLQKKLPILPDESAGSLHDRLSVLSASLLIDAIEGLSEGKIKEIPQDDKKATYAPKIKKEMTRIVWNEDAKKISAKIRAFDPFPGALSRIKGKEIKLFSSSVLREDLEGDPGRIFRIDKEGLFVEAKKGIVLIREVQVSGRRRIKVSEFIKGFPLKEGDRFDE